jgi:hypothetical protein
MRKRWKVWAAAGALALLLAAVVGATLFFLKPSVAQQKAALLREGMTPREVEEAAGVKFPRFDRPNDPQYDLGVTSNFAMEDFSRLIVRFGPGKEGFPVRSVRTRPPPYLQLLRESLSEWLSPRPTA